MRKYNKTWGAKRSSRTDVWTYNATHAGDGWADLDRLNREEREAREANERKQEE